MNLPNKTSLLSYKLKNIFITISKKSIYILVLTGILFLGLVIYKYERVSAEIGSQIWNMAGGNPARTSWVDSDVTALESGSAGISWYRPIEAYIDQKTQIITANGSLYISTSNGLVVLDAEDGSLKWRFDTELPLGNSPTVIDDMVYVGGYDRKVYAIRDNGTSYTLEWEFTAQAGFSTNPIVVNSNVYLGSRDGYFYALDSLSGNLVWRYPDIGQEPIAPILQSAAYDAGVLYFAASDMYAYSLNATNGSLIVKSPEKLPGDRMHAFWPVIYGNRVIFSTSHGYKEGVSPGINDIGTGSFNEIEKDDFYGHEDPSYAGDIITATGSEGWDAGTQLLDTEIAGTNNAYSIDGYLTQYPDRQTVVALDKTTFVRQADPVPYMHNNTRSGNRSPSMVNGNTNILYSTNQYQNAAISRVKVTGWNPTNKYLSILGSSDYAVDEPIILSGAGDSIFMSLCCDRIAGEITSNKTFWDYPYILEGELPAQTDPDPYDPTWGFWSNSMDLERLKGYYKGLGSSNNGVYNSHGLQNPLVPYSFVNDQAQTVKRLFIHRSNTIIAIGETETKTSLPIIEINTAPTNTGTTLTTQEITNKLETEIDKMVSLWELNGETGFLNAGYYNTGIDFASYPQVYFSNPADTLLVLTQAYSHVNASLQTRLLSYMNAFYTKYFVTNQVKSLGWADGTPREYMDYPTEVNASMALSPDSTVGQYTTQRHFYALWKYAQLNPSEALNIYNNISGTRIETPNISNTYPVCTHERTPFVYADYISGYTGYLQLQELAFGGSYSAGEQTIRNTIQSNLNDLQTYRITNFNKDHPYPGTDESGITTCLTNINQYARKYNISRNFIYMNPELGDAFRTDRLSDMQIALEEYQYVAPFWFVNGFDNTFQEGILNQLYDPTSIMNARAWILQESGTQLSKYIDTPVFEYGDLNYMTTLVTTLDNMDITPPAETLGISNMQVLSTLPLDKYDKFEMSFDITNTVATNFQIPYDSSAPLGVDGDMGITVNVEFTPDNWTTTYTQPAFYYQNFQEDVKGGNEWFLALDDYSWRVRFTPNVAGTWLYRVKAEDASGLTQSSFGSFTVVESSNKGFLRVSDADSRYFEFEDGTYFPGLGINLNYDQVSWINPVTGNSSQFQGLSSNNIQLVRMWLSQWSIFGSAWNPWYSPVAEHTTQSIVPKSFLVSSESAPGSEFAMVINNEVNRCMYVGYHKAPPAIERNTDYRIRVKYKSENILNAQDGVSPYGFVAKFNDIPGGNLNDTCYSAGSGTVVTPYVSENTMSSGEVWRTLEGTWNSGTNDYLPLFYLVLENVTQDTSVARVFVDQVWIEKDLGSGQYGPNILYKGDMDQHMYMDQRNSLAFDKVVELAHTNDIYLRPVLQEIMDPIFQKMNPDGTLDDNVTEANGLTNFYGDFTNSTKTRWHQQSWWRYVQARWGYSPNIQSWELLNEGDPASTRHYTLADEFGGYMKQFAPNDHLVSTSFWHSFPAANFWGSNSYPNVDFADVHRYIALDESPDLYTDTALASYNQSMSRRTDLNTTGITKPIVRGEVGFTQTSTQPASPDLLADTNGVWLHNFLWGGLNSGAMMESYWYFREHINNTGAGLDHRSEFSNYYNFVKDIPLNNGNFVDAQPAITPALSNIRAWGQKDSVNKTAHLWISNDDYNWQNLNPTSDSATVTLDGFSPDATVEYKTYDTYSGLYTNTSNLTADSSGNLDIPITNLSTDLAVMLTETSAPEPVNDNTLVAHWSFTDSVDEDISGCLNCVNNGATVINDAISGNGYSFDGVNDYINLGDFNYLQGLQDLTVSFWLRPGFDNTSTQRQYLLANGTILSIYYLEVSNSWRITLRTASGNNILGTTGLTWNADEWAMLTFTYDGTNGRVYWNDTLNNSSAMSGSIVSTGGSPNSLGALSSMNSFYYNGDIDELRVYNKALTSTEVSDLYQSYINPSAPDTVLPVQITPNGGTFTDSVLVDMFTYTPDASIYYTLDGTDPTQASTLYTTSFELTDTTTVKARAYRSGYTESSIITANFIVNPSSGNVAPVTNSQVVTTNVDTPAVINLSYSDTDSGPGPYTVSIVSSPTHGSLSGTGSSYTYTPDSGYTGSDIFTWKINDGADDSNTSSVNISINQASSSNALIVDHDLISLFDTIPDQYLTAARNIKFLFRHASVGANIDAGLNCMAWDVATQGAMPNSCTVNNDPGLGSIDFVNDPVKYARDNWTFECHTLDWANCNPGWWNKQDLFEQRIAGTLSPTSDYPVLEDVNNFDVWGFKFGNVDDGASSNINMFWDIANASNPTQRITDLETIEANNPTKTLMYWTMGIGRLSYLASHNFNNTMREYALNNDKVLFDLADIVSHHSDGSACLDTDGSGNVIAEVCDEYTQEVNGGHLNARAQVRVAKGLWVMMSCLGGWDGCGTSVTPPDPNVAPVASFTANPLSGDVPLEVSFDANGSTDSDGTIVSYQWNFGDGTVASGVTQTKTFSNVGSYTVRLTVIDDDGSNHYTEQVITVNAQNVNPVSSFTATPLSGTAPLLVNFNGSGSSDSDGTISSYLWNFGDGTSGYEAILSKTYSSAGTYTVRLTVTDDDGGMHYTEQTITVTAPSGNILPVASFIADPVSGTVPLTVDFNSSGSSDSDGTISSYLWDFGDGNTSSNVIDTIIYSTPGVYTVRLTVTDNDGDTHYVESTITANAPTPNSPSVSTPLSPTYSSEALFEGNKQGNNSIRFNNNVVVNEDGNTTWSYTASLTIGLNSFIITSGNSYGQYSSGVNRNVSRYGLGDINGDGTVNVFDLGILAGNYGSTGVDEISVTNLRMSDMNVDASVNVFDLGILAGKYGTVY